MRSSYFAVDLQFCSSRHYDLQTLFAPSLCMLEKFCSEHAPYYTTAGICSTPTDPCWLRASITCRMLCVNSANGDDEYSVAMLSENRQ